MNTKLQNIINTSETNKQKGLILIDFNVNKEKVKINKDGEGFCEVVFSDVNVKLFAEIVSARSVNKSHIAFFMDLTNGTCKIVFCVLKTDYGFMKYEPAEVKVDDVKEYFKEIGLDINFG